MNRPESARKQEWVGLVSRERGESIEDFQREMQEKNPSGGSRKDADDLKCVWCLLNIIAQETLF